MGGRGGGTVNRRLELSDISCERRESMRGGVEPPPPLSLEGVQGTSHNFFFKNL